MCSAQQIDRLDEIHFSVLYEFESHRSSPNEQSLFRWNIELLRKKKSKKTISMKSSSNSVQKSENFKKSFTKPDTFFVTFDDFVSSQERVYGLISKQA